MINKRLKKLLLIVLGIFGFIIVLIPITLRLAFGPINSSGEIQITEKIKLEYDETYNSDFAGEFYEVKFKKNDSILGYHTFHNKDWAKHFFVDSLSGRSFLFIADSTLDNKRLNGYYLISFKPDFQNVIDTIFNETEEFYFQDKMEEMIKKH
ncbi:hypothetical protein [Algoriphagus pacificus]|uniref:Uncharacterized protein n=1 Tax=Algoriphagus pacificus TaxID=2811234 RepID=A0ABS3CD09_9BACT|nr:hypothetical protein [Algoriphagus pacificus]MBN7814424.1 hypothetical protein [Algoriphagus pacificus]